MPSDKCAECDQSACQAEAEEHMPEVGEKAPEGVKGRVYARVLESLRQGNFENPGVALIEKDGQPDQ